MKMKIITISIMITLLGLPLANGEIVLTFDDISLSDSGLIPDGYGGFNWDHFYYLNAPAVYPNSGFMNGRVSGDYVALVSHYDEPGIGKIIGDLFTFQGAYFIAGWRDGLNIQIDGYLDDELIYSTTVVVDTTGPTWFDFDYIDIDTLEFSSYGGTHHEGYPFDGEYFAMDNFTHIPEATTLLLFALGAVLLRNRSSLKPKS